MAMLAVLDVDDLATPKIAKVKNALDDLSAQTAQTAKATSAASKGFIDATGIDDQLKAVAALNKEMVGIRAQSGAWNLLSKQMQEGTKVTKTQAAALMDLSGALLDSDKASHKLKFGSMVLAGGLKEGATVTGELRQKLVALTGEFDRSNGLISKTGESAQQAASKMDVMRQQAAVLHGAMAALAAGGLYAFLRGSVDLAARIETLGVVLNVAAKNAGYTAGQLRAQVEEVKRLGVTSKEATDSVLSLVNANVRVADSSKLARAAQDLAVVAGENSSQTLGRLINAIETQNIRMLRSVGIVTSTEKVMQNYATTLGKTAKDLTELERKQAVVNTILEEAGKFTGAYEASMDTAGKKIGSMARLTEELRLKIGEALLPTFTAITNIVFKFLDALNKLPPSFFQIAAAIGTMLAVMTALAGVIAAAKFLALGAAIASLLTPVGLVVAAIGALAGALVYFNSVQEASLQKNVEYIGAIDQTNEKLKDSLGTYQRLTAEGVTLSGATGELDAKQKLLKQSTNDLAKAVPAAITQFDALTGTYKLNIAEVERQISANERLRESYLRAAGAQIQTQETQLAEMKKRRDALISEQQKLEESAKPRLLAGDAPIWERLWNKVVPAKDIHQKRQEIGTELLALMKDISGLETSLKLNKETVGDLTATIEQKIAKVRETVTKVGWDEFQTKAKKFGVSLKEAFDPKAMADPQKYREVLAGLVSEVDRAEQKAIQQAEANAKKAENIRKGITERATQDSLQLRVTADALNSLFSKALKSGDEQKYFDLLREFSKELLNLKGNALTTGEGMAPLRTAIEDVTKLSLATWAKEAAEQLAAVEKASADVISKFEGQVIQATHEAQRERIKLREDTNEKIEDMDRDLFERTTVSKMAEVDQAIYAERRRVEEISKAVEKEIRDRERALEQRRKDVEMRAALAKQEVEDLIRAVEMKRNIRQVEMEAELEDALREKDTKRAEALQQEIDRQERVTQIYLERAGKIRDAANKEIEIIRQRGLATIEADRKTNEEVAANQRAAVERQVEGSARIQQEIRTQYDTMSQAAKAAFVSITDSAQQGVIAILTGQKSLKEGLLGIWQSIKQSLLGIFDSIVKGWIQSAAKMATGAGGFDVSKFFGGLMGKGRMPGMPGMPGGAPGDFVGPPAPGGGGYFGMSRGVGGGLIGGAVGGAVGFGIGSSTGSRTWGALSGAGTGAATGAMFGGPLGAGIGAAIGGLAGLFGGWFGGKKQAEETKRMREELLQSAGGLEELKKKAEDAGFSLDKLLSTKKPKDFEAEVKKLNKALEDREKVKALEEVKKALDEAKASLGDLDKQAQLVGFDMKKLYDAKTIEEFNAAQEELNKLLAEQEKRLQGLGTAAAGIKARVAGLTGFLERSVEDWFKEFSDKSREQFEKDFKAAQEAGFTGSEFKFAQENAEKYGLSLDRLNERQARVQESLNRIGQYAMATFGGILRETGDIMQAFAAIAEPLDEMAAIMAETGTEAQGAFAHLMEFRNVVRNNEDVAQSLTGINQILAGLAQSGRLTAEMFNTIGGDAAEQWRIMEERGVAADQALLLMQPTLQKLYEAQKQYGFATDEATQKLIDMGIANGVVGDQFQDVNSRMLDMLVIIAEALGATIPDAYKRQQEAAEQAGQAGTQAAEDQATALEETALQAEEAYKKWLDLEREMSRMDTSGVDDLAGAIGDLPDKFGDAAAAAVDFARTAGDALGDVEGDVNAISLGRSPGGLKEIRIKVREAIEALRDLRASGRDNLRDVEDAVGGVVERMEEVQPATGDVFKGENKGGDPFAEETAPASVQVAPPTGEQPPAEPAATATQPPVQVVFQPEFKIDTIDAAGMEQAVREKIGPQIITQMRSNTDQLTVEIGRALDRYFGSRTA